jgi:hypothetical protein
MALGDFLGKLKGGEKVEPPKFLALVLTDEVVQAAVWHVVNEQTEIVAVGTPVEWDGDTGTTSELVSAVDATISNAVEGVGTEPNGVILGISLGWTDAKGILGSKHDFIKTICKELELKPLGYVITTDSILSYLKMQEGTPTTSILIQVSRDELTLVLVRLGRVEGVETIGRSDDVVKDVIEGVARFKVADNLPSRIILFNSMHNLDDIIQNLLSIDWQAQFNFLHLPKVEALPKDVAIRALAVAGGGEVAKSLGFSVSATPVPSATPPESPVQPSPREEPIEDKATLEESDVVSAESVGFTSGDVEALPATEIESFQALDTNNVIPPVAGEEELLPPEETPLPKPSRPKLSLPAFALPKLAPPKFKFALPRHFHLPLLLIGGALVLVLGFLFWFIWILPTAKVTIHLTPKTLTQDINLTLSTTAVAVDQGSSVVPATLVTTSQTGEKTVPTTGKKTIGDPAKGDVTIYNLTSLPKTFTAGTTISSGSLKFTLDSDTTVASSSTSIDPNTQVKTTTPGTASVSVTATNIGTGSNLPAGTQFNIANFGQDSYLGKNSAALTGGTSQDIQVVSKDDQAGAVKGLTTELLQALASQTGSNTPGVGTYLINSSAKVTSESDSAKVGEKAVSFTTNLTVSASLLSYKTADVSTLVNSAIDQAIPSGFTRTTIPASVDLSASTVNDKGDTVTGTAKVSISLLPVFDQKNLAESLKGKATNSIASILGARLPGYQSAEIQITPLWLPPRFKSLPLNPKNITFTLVPAI